MYFSCDVIFFLYSTKCLFIYHICLSIYKYTDTLTHEPAHMLRASLFSLTLSSTEGSHPLNGGGGGGAITIVTFLTNNYHLLCFYIMSYA